MTTFTVSTGEEDKLALLEAWFPLEDHEVRKAGGNKVLVYVSSEAINRRMNSIFGFDWETKCVKITDVVEHPEKDNKGNRQWFCTSQVDMTIWLDNKVRTRSGTGAAVGTDIDMVIKSALVEGKKKAFYEFGGCLYLWDDRNCNRIKACLNGDPNELEEILEHYDMSAPADASVDDLIDLVFAIRT